MNLNCQILRQNDRNISCKEVYENKCIFKKQSLSPGSNPSEEYFFWEYFYKLETDMIPFCVNADANKKAIMYEWLEGYEQISGKYTPVALKRILDYLKVNSEKNTFYRLKNDCKLVSLSERRLQQQLEYFNDICERATDFYSDFISRDSFKKAFNKALYDFSCKDTLCHGDLGKSNILIKGNDIKIIDFEYSMFSSRELDYGRLASSIFLSYQNKEIDKDLFFEMISLIANAPIRLDKLAGLTGLQLTMRIVHTYKSKENMPGCVHNQVKTALNLLSFKDENCTNQEFLNLFIL